jgi:hypothetical protein
LVGPNPVPNSSTMSPAFAAGLPSGNTLGFGRTDLGHLLGRCRGRASPVTIWVYLPRKLGVEGGFTVCSLRKGTSRAARYFAAWA